MLGHTDTVCIDIQMYSIVSNKLSESSSCCICVAEAVKMLANKSCSMIVALASIYTLTNVIISLILLLLSPFVALFDLQQLRFKKEVEGYWLFLQGNSLNSSLSLHVWIREWTMPATAKSRPWLYNNSIMGYALCFHSTCKKGT